MYASISYSSSLVYYLCFWENCNSPDLLLILWDTLSLSPLRHGNSRRRANGALPATALIGLVTLIFDLLTSK